MMIKTYINASDDLSNDEPICLNFKILVTAIEEAYYRPEGLYCYHCFFDGFIGEHELFDIYDTPEDFEDGDG